MRFLRFFVALFVLTLAALVHAQPGAPAARPLAQGVAVLGTNGAREPAFALARAVYATTLRPKTLDELRARILGGDAPPVPTTKEMRDLAELRAGVTGDDAASRSLLANIAQQTGVQAILVVTKRAEESDAGAEAGTIVVARLFLADSGDYDAARYEPEGEPTPWRRTVTSLGARFPTPPAAVAKPLVVLPAPVPHEDKPFYKSPWLWGAVGAALLIGGIFLFASQDKSGDPIHVRLGVPH